MPDCLLCGNYARTGGQTCWFHHDAMARMLDPDNHGNPAADIPASIPVMWSMLDLTPGSSGDTTRRAPGFRSTPPLSLHLLTMIDDRSKLDPQVWYDPHPSGIGDDPNRPHNEDDNPPRAIRIAIESLVDNLVQDLPVEGPDLPDGRYLTDLTVMGMCAWLHGQVHELTNRPDSDWLFDDLLQLSDQLRPAVGDRHMDSVGKCIEMVRDPTTRTYDQCRCPLYLPPPVRDPQDETTAAKRERERTQVIVTCRRCYRPYTRLDLIRVTYTDRTA